MFDRLVLDSFAILVLSVLILGMYLPDTPKDKTTRRFNVLLLASFSFLVINLLCDIFEGNANLSGLIFTVNLLSFFAIDGAMVAFLSYLDSRMKGEKGTFHFYAIHAGYFTIGIRAFTTLIFALTGKLFTVEDGVFIEGELISLPYIILGIALAEIVAILIINRKRFSKSERIIMYIYALLPLVPIVTENLFDWYEMTGITVTLALLLIYVVIQASTIEGGKMRESLLREMSVKDLLTGLYNRRAFYERSQFRDGSKTVGLVFCDVNGLKKTNDEKGHIAGDRLLLDFSEILKANFNENDIYRIGGDEFLAVLTDVTEEEFEKTVARFCTETDAHANIAAVGAAFGACADVSELLTEAEAKMYRDKIKHKQARS